MLQAYDVGNGVKSAIIGLGSNLSSKMGNSLEILEGALGMLAKEGIRIQAVSRFYTTPCFPEGAGPDYVNAAAVLKVEQTSMDVMSRLHEVEELMGRERVVRWGQRTLDLDLLAVGDEVAPNLKDYLHWRNLPIEEQSQQAPDQLVLPHPRLQDRAFVLVPMADVAPDWLHPVTGRSTRQMLAELDASEVAKIVPL